MSNKPKKTSILQTIAENTIGLITTAIFSIGLISGSGYLLFEAQNELNKMAQVNAGLEKQLAEWNLGIEMANIGSSGWLTENSSGMILGTTIGIMENSLSNDNLDDTFAKDTINWSLKSLTQLTSEREKISGYVFSNKTILQSQSATLKVYDTQIILLQEILKLAQHWEENNLAERQSQFSTIQLKWIDVKASVDALDTSSSQLNSDQEISTKQSELELDEMKDNYNSFNIRFWLSVLGVLLGLVLFFGSITYLVIKYIQPQKKVSNVPARKTTKTKGKSR